MSKRERFIDPNSGAAPQPGGYAGQKLKPKAEKSEAEMAQPSNTPKQPDLANPAGKDAEERSKGVMPAKKSAAKAHSVMPAAKKAPAKKVPAKKVAAKKAPAKKSSR